MKIKAALIAASIALMLLSISCNEKNENGQALYDRIYNRFDSLHDAGRDKEAQQFADSLATCKGPVSRYYLLARYNCKAEASYYFLKVDSNRLYVDSAFQVMTRYPDMQMKATLLYGKVLTSKADLDFNAGNLPRAFEYYSLAKIHAEKIGDTCVLGNLIYHLGMVSYRQEKYPEAIAHFHESFLQDQTCPAGEYSYFRRVELLGNIALAYTQLRSYDSAMKYYKASLAYISDHKGDFTQESVKAFAEVATGVAYGNMAKVFVAKKMADSAIKWLHASIAINDHPDRHFRDALYACMVLAELYYDIGKLAEADNVLFTMHQKLKNGDEPPLDIRMEHLEYMIKRKRSDPGAIAHLEAYVRLKKTADSINKGLGQVDYGHILQIRDAQYQINLLQKNQELNRIYLIVSLGAVLAVLCIVGLVYRNFRRTKKNVAALTRLNNQVNEQKAQLQDAMAMLKDSMDDKDRILHVVAHDLRNPVSAVISIATLLMEDEMAEEHKAMLKMMSNASTGSLVLINELLEFSGNQARKPEHKEETDINMLVAATADILKYKADEKQQVISLVLAAEGARAFVNPGKMSRVISNLVTNAIKFSPGGAKITVTTARHENSLRITVADSGIGIPENEQAQLFNAFTNARRRGTSGEVSFGLGLSICKQIVEAENGRIWFESQEGRGSSFFVELPMTD